MASASTPAVAHRLPFARLRDLALPLGLIAALLVIIVPVPAQILDVLLAANITLAVIILLTTVSVRTPLEFSVFPTLLLVTTLARLVLNVATTRLILSQGQTEGLLAAGGVVKGFGEFVAGDRLAVGIVIFAILVIIQFVVITKGATRISEVAARFALDGMPGKQMAVDADLAAGVIDQQEAQRRRHDISRQADFFGAMDGASKFVRGDAVAGVIITLVNIVGGLAIGIIQGGMSLSDAGSVYTKLTIGDGLATQIPALLISLAAALLVTRSSSATNLPRELAGQLFSRPQVLIVAGCFLAALVWTELPRIPLIVLGGSCIGLSWMLTRRDKAAAETAAEIAKAESQQLRPTPERVEQFLAVDPLEVEVGLALVRLADPKRRGDLLERVQRVRQSVAAELGILMPKVRIRDNLQLDQHQYRIRIMDVVVAQGVVMPAKLLAVDAGHVTQQLAGRETRDPVSGARSVWIEPGERQRAELSGYKVLEASGVIVAHLTETVRRHADELLTRDATRHLLDELKQTQPAVVDELIPGQLKLAEVQQVLQLLLREQVSIRQLGPILESLGDAAPQTRDPAALAQYVRQRLARTLSHRYRDPDGTLHVVTLDPNWEQQIADAPHGADTWRSTLPPAAVERITGLVADAIEPLTRSGRPGVLLVQPQVRAAVKRLLEPRLPQLVVLGFNEVTRDTNVVAAAMVGEDGSTMSRRDS